MPINTETLNSKLYHLLSKYDPKPLDADGKVTPMENEADVFKFEFTKDGESYGDVFATVDDDRKIVLYYKDDVTQSPDSPTPGIGYNDTWWGFLEQIAKWWPRQGFSGRVLKDTDKLGSDMARRKNMKNKDQLGEGYYPMGKSRSYSDAVPSVKIVIEHSRVIEEGEQRYRNINRIFLENQLGERYLLDTKKPGIARVYARHIAEGGKVNDDRWSHIGSLCEEYQKMAGFVRATRNGQFNESAQQLVNEGLAHYESLRESLSRLTGKRGYNAYFESWTPSLMEDGVEENNLNELFVQETLDPRIESVMPILSRIHKKVSESIVDKEVNKLAEWADSLSEAEGESLTSNNPVGIPESLDQHSPVTQAITRRILMQHPDLLQKYGPEKVGDAIDSVAEFVGDVEEIGSSDVSGWVKQVAQSLDGIAEGKGNLASALDTLKGSWSGWEQLDSGNPDIEEYYFDDGEGGHDSTGTIEHNLKTGKITVDYSDEYDNEVKGTFNSIGDAMNALRGGSPMRGGGKAPNHDSLGGRSAGSDDLYKTDRAGKKGTLTKSRMDTMKASSQYRMRGGPKGVLPEEEEVAEEVDMGQYDAAKSTHKGEPSADWEKNFREKLKQYTKELEQRQKEKDVDEGLDANQKRVGQLGPTEKVGPKGAVGKLVGANENFINTVDQAVTTEDEMDEGEHTQHAMRDRNPGANEFEHDFEPEDKVGNIHDKISKMLKKLSKPNHEPNMKDTDLGSTVLDEVDLGQYDAVNSTSNSGTTPEQEKEFRKKVQAYGQELDQRQKEKQKEKDNVKEGQEDFDAILRIIRK